MYIKQSGLESLYVSSEKNITPQKQLGVSFPGTKHYIFGNQFSASSNSMHFCIFMLEIIWYHNFT